MLVLIGLALPSAVWAQSGGSGGAAVGGSGGSGATPQSSNTTATVSGSGFTLTARTSALLSHQLGFTGSVPAGDRNNTVVVQRLDPKAGWVTLATAKAGSNGTFSAVWSTNHAGRMATRVIVPTAGSATAGGTSAQAPANSPALQVTIYRQSIATTYGPGFWGTRTACGVILRRQTVGVANRTLPCGTRVSVLYGGHTLVVPVIDRGPYANHANWDLTMATAKALNIDGTVKLGAATVGRGR